MKVWITRARPGAEATAARLTARGFTPVVSPLLEVRRLPAALDLTGVDALVFTSLNAVAAFAALSPDRSLAVFAVGDATAKAARESGFAPVRSADGDLSALAALIRAEGSGLTLLHPAAARPAGDLAARVGDSVCVRSVAVYDTVETETAPPEPWDAVLIHSPRAARALAATKPHVRGRLACAISTAAGEPLAHAGFELRIAAAPTEDALLDTLGNPQPGV